MGFPVFSGGLIMQPILSMNNISKTYPGGIEALKKASFEVYEGEIHALVGENGAGKTTMMNILYGLVKPDEGEIKIRGKRKVIRHPRDAIENGIGMVHQHFMLVPELTVLENILLGFEKKFVKSFWRIDKKAAEEKARELMKSLGMELPLDTPVDFLPIGYKQRTEIVKTLFRGIDILILDEPTSVLAPMEIKEFLLFLKKLKEKGKTVIFISHKLKEVFEIADRITILRRGKNVGTFRINEISEEEVAKLMVGEKLRELSSKSEMFFKDEEAYFYTKDLSYVRHGKCILDNIQINVKRGEIVGIAGIEGNGQEELSQILIGLLKPSQGQVIFRGKDITNLSVEERRRMGIGYIPPDRIKWGLALEASIVKNCAINFRRTFLKRGISIDWKKAYQISETIIKEFDVRGVRDLKEPVSSLSGGNMQKLMVGREHHTAPEFLIVSQPTAGVDIQAQRLIHSKLLELRNKKVGILLISLDLEELLLLSDRLYVIFNGKITKEFSSPKEFDIQEISSYMTGIKS